MAADGLPLRRIDHVRFFVGNARQSAYFYRNAFGFDVVAYAGLETRQRQEAGYVLRQGKITFVLISPLSGQHPESGRLNRHGDGVQDIALHLTRVIEERRRRAHVVPRGRALQASFFQVRHTSSMILSRNSGARGCTVPSAGRRFTRVATHRTEF